MGHDNAPPRQGLVAESSDRVPAVEDASPLPATVARLVRNAESPKPAGAPEIVAQLDQRGPVVLPLPQVVPRVDLAGTATGATGQSALGDPALPVQRVTATAANVRQGPSTGFDVVGRLTRGEEVAVLEKANGWAHIRIEGDGVEGWISTRLLGD